ncbi:MAG: site-2 protease family protein [Clostridiales bacterium]|nr:site-2 protease family protein [Clostridiales bacterium]
MTSLISAILSGNLILAVIVILSRAFVVFVCMPVHELSHGWAAYKLGDDTAKAAGRLSFNPIAHLNPVGTIMIFLFGIGYAQPVPINPLKFKDYRKGVALTAAAGPFSNLVMGFISAFFYSMLQFIYNNSGNSVINLVGMFFYFAASVNVSLAVFNLLPIPPLDGSRILAVVLPDRAYEKYFRYERIIMIVLFIALFSGILNKPISFLTNLFMNIICFIPNLIFGL